MQTSEILLELGAVLVGLAVLARLSSRFGVPSIPLYLLAGLAFGEGGILPLVTTAGFVEIGAELGLILLLFMLGLEYSASELLSTLKTGAGSGAIDCVANFLPGFLAGLLFGWGAVPAIILGGVCYVSSSGIAARLIDDLHLGGRPEARVTVTVLIIEDLAMAAFLPIVAGLLIGGFEPSGLLTAALAGVGVIVILVVASRVELGLSRALFSHSDEALLLSILGITIFVAGLAEAIEVSAAVGALLVGIVLSGPAAKSARNLLAPLRDLFAAFFFAFVGLSVDPGTIPPVLPAAVALAVVTGASKMLSSWWVARRDGVDRPGSWRTAALLLARGEFSIALAGLAVTAGIEPELGPVAVGYVLLLAVLGPIAAKIVDSRTRRKEVAASDPTRDGA
jgi:CPA2 family monovalent cation:H+ antiporter-2